VWTEVVRAKLGLSVGVQKSRTDILSRTKFFKIISLPPAKQEKLFVNVCDLSSFSQAKYFRPSHSLFQIQFVIHDAIFRLMSFQHFVWN
jgi:hypothetical protein